MEALATLEAPPPDWPAPVKWKRTRPHTAEELRAERPEVARAIIKLHLSGTSYRAMQDAFNVSPSTIRALLEQSPAVATRAREGLALTFRHGAARLIERVHEVLDDDDQRAKVSAKDAAFAAATLSERADSMQGHATQIVEVQVVDPARDELNAALLQAMRPAQQLPPAIDVTPEPLKEDVQSVRDDVRIEKTDLPSPPAPAMPAEYAPGPMTAAAQVGQREDAPI